MSMAAMELTEAPDLVALREASHHPDVEPADRKRLARFATPVQAGVVRITYTRQHVAGASQLLPCWHVQDASGTDLLRECARHEVMDTMLKDFMKIFSSVPVRDGRKTRGRVRF